MKGRRLASDCYMLDCGCWIDEYEQIHYCVKHKPALDELEEIVSSFNLTVSQNHYVLRVKAYEPEGRDPFG